MRSYAIKCPHSTKSNIDTVTNYSYTDFSPRKLIFCEILSTEPLDQAYEASWDLCRIL